MEGKRNKNIHKDFNSLFNKKERITLLGNHFINLWALGLILFVTFVAIGFANGSLDYLAKKMSDPYVNWVNIDLDQATSENSNSIIFNCNLDSIKSKYDIISTDGYNIFWLDISDYKDDNRVQTEIGRTIELHDTLIGKIIEEKYYGDSFENENDYGLIVTKKLLDKYHYPENSKYIYHNYSYEGEFGAIIRNIPIPIIAVTKSLPGNAQFISLPFFYYNRMKISSTYSPFIVDDENSLLLFVNNEKVNANSLSDDITNFLLNDNYYRKFNPYNVAPKNMSFDGYYNIKITFEPSPNNVYFIDTVYNYLLENDIINNKEVVRLYDIESRLATNMSADHHFIAINFNELGKIREFADYMAVNNNIQIDIAQIEAKENYSFITKLTKIISLILIGFSILSICLFLSNLLRNHLEKISMNIGTFKAFGLDSATLQRIYLKVIFSVVLSAMAISMVAGWLFGKIGGMRLFLKMFGSDKLEQGEDYFQLFDFWTLLSISLILLISFVVLSITARRILRKSPGDLIYDR